MQQGLGTSNIETADRVSQFYFSQFKALTAAKLTETVFQKYSPKPFFGSITRHLQKSHTNVIGMLTLDNPVIIAPVPGAAAKN